ncbi:hypothetical protein PPL_05163 [Heterostelium album PN500]|uniref:N-acetyltransferase domain-containing protein n=1 Tax=Heterostelium pallidum (strain ATCC 26659 / Pp 5 / PN500) TaxID=670386 RepID=D3B9L9_HETP5|nr:hypothetical protein PPL_05163 [Heterostelium album PN500]EFA81931.1 hypothetical protein PPL_05163 [Heterostelium album PN500]|eukprot:XP_020434048.1 hypothetical protein PPL_05163 [Heterostelium album PN500]
MELSLESPILYESERLIYKEMQVGVDEPFLIELFNDPLCLRFIGFRTLTCTENAAKYIESLNKSFRDNGFSMLKVCRKEAPDVPIGTSGFVARRPNEHDADVNLGYAFMESGRGQGYALESSIASIQYIAKKLDTKRFGANVNNDNQRSSSLLTKIGFQYSRTIKMDNCETPLDIFILEIQNLKTDVLLRK